MLLSTGQIRHFYSDGGVNREKRSKSKFEKLCDEDSLNLWAEDG